MVDTSTHPFEQLCAELAYLRAIERAARALQEADFACTCYSCFAEELGCPRAPAQTDCLLDKLRNALARGNPEVPHG